MLTHFSSQLDTSTPKGVTSSLNDSSSFFQLANETEKRARWVAHVSMTSQLIAVKELILHIKPTTKVSAFDIIERVLFAKTCKSIHTDASFTLNQLKMLKEMAMFSGTEIVFISDKNDFNQTHANELEKA